MQRSMVAEFVNDDPVPRVGARSATPAGSSDVGDLWRILWCRGRVILAVVLFCGIGTLLYIIVTRSEYSATAQILIDPRDLQIVTKDVNPDTLASDGGILQVESQSRVIESDAVLLRAVRVLGLAKDPDYGVRTTGLVSKLLAFVSGGEDADDPVANENRALRALRKHLAVKRADKVFVVDVTITAYSGTKAAAIADAIAQAYLDDQVEARADASSRASSALAGRLQELRKGVETAAADVERYKASHDLLGTDKQLISDQQLNDNGTQLDNARAKVAELQARVDQLDTLRHSGLDGGAMQEAIQSAVITQLRASQSELTRRRSDMRTRYGDRYPDLIAIDAEINQTRTLINAELDRLMRAAHADLDRAKKNEQALTRNQDALKQQTVSSNHSFISLQELVRELDARRAVYQAFLARAGETKEQSGIDNTNARIISRAIPPVQASWPLRVILLLGALGGGLGLGAALAFVLEYLAPTILSAGQLEAASQAPVVGIVSGRPRSRLAPPRSWFRSWRGRAKAMPMSPDRAAMALRLALSRLCGPLNALGHAPMPRTLFLVLARDVARAPVDLPGRIAAAAAQANVSVLLIDTEPHAGSGSHETLGFLNVLNGECNMRAVLSRDASTGICHLGLGTPLASRGEAFTPERLDNFFKFVGRNFNLILFSGSAFVDDLNAAVLAACVDDVLFLALRGRTAQKEAMETADAVAASTGRPLSGSLLIDRVGGM